ncbi:MAG: hypothetical protein ACRCTR_08645 [Actinomycetota bacterium]
MHDDVALAIQPAQNASENGADVAQLAPRVSEEGRHPLTGCGVTNAGDNEAGAFGQSGRYRVAAFCVGFDGLKDLMEAVGCSWVVDDVWAPHAAEVAAWVRSAREVATSEQVLTVLEKSRDWLKNSELRLKNEWLAEVAAEARTIWSELKQASNVEIGDVALEGSTTVIDPTVAAAALREPAHVC